MQNHTNNEIKKAKRLYFTKNLDLHKDDIKKTWKLINELNSRNRKKTNNISKIKMGEEVITSPMEMAEAFNSYFTNVGVTFQLKYLPRNLPQNLILHQRTKFSQYKFQQ